MIIKCNPTFFGNSWVIEWGMSGKNVTRTSERQEKDTDELCVLMEPLIFTGHKKQPESCVEAF